MPASTAEMAPSGNGGLEPFGRPRNDLPRPSHLAPISRVTAAPDRSEDSPSRQRPGPAAPYRPSFTPAMASASSPEGRPGAVFLNHPTFPVELTRVKYYSTGRLSAILVPLSYCPQ